MPEIGIVNASDRVDKNTVVNFHALLNSIFKIDFSDRLLNEIDYTYDLYKDFIDKYEQIDEKTIYDEAMRMNETLYLHSMELNNTAEKQKLITSFANERVRKDSIPYVCEKYLSKHHINIPNIKKLHTILMEGIALEESKQKSFRKDNEMFVGFWIDKDTKYVHYYPTMSRHITKQMESVLVYLNDPELNQAIPNTYLVNYQYIDNFDKKYVLFLQPLIVHALITIVQPFEDGNSRTARLINYASMLGHTNQIFYKDYKLPLIYLSKFYLPYNRQYRNYIKNIAVEPNSDNWNKWFMMGLHTMQDYMNYADTFINDNQLIKNKK